MDKFLSMTSQWGAGVTNQFTKTTELAKQKLGQVEHKTELPEEYIRLRKRIQALEQANSRMIKVTSNFSKETYDYPSNLGETFTEVSRNFLDSVNHLAHATSAQEATAALTGNHPNTVHQPKTFSHAISRAAFASSGYISNSRADGTSEEYAADRLADALEKYAVACEQIGSARIEQDVAIQNGALNGWNEANKVNIRYAITTCKQLEEARLELDVLKSQAKGGLFAPKKKTPTGEVGDEHSTDDSLTDEQRQKIEDEEAAFNSQVKDAESMVTTVLNQPESFNSLVELVKAQYQYHQTSADLLAKLMADLGEA